MNDNTAKTYLLGAVLLAGVGYLGYNLFWLPFEESGKQIQALEKANSEKRLEVAKAYKDKKQLERWRSLSLPGVESLPVLKPGAPGAPLTPSQKRFEAERRTQDMYRHWLRDVLRKNGIVGDPKHRAADSKEIPKLADGTPVYTVLAFDITAVKTKKDNLVGLLRDLEAAPILHRVRTLSVKRDDQSVAGVAKASTDVLAVSLTVEAVIINGARKRGEQLIALTQPIMALEAAYAAVRKRDLGLGWIPWEKLYDLATMPKGRKYDGLAKNSIFDGKFPGKEPPPPPIDLSWLTWRWPPPQKTPEKSRPTKDLISYVHLTDVTIDNGKAWATLYPRATEQPFPVQVRAGYDTIPLVRSGQGDVDLLIRGRVLGIEPRGVTFRVELYTTSPDEEPEKKRHKNATVIYSLSKAEAAKLAEKKVKDDEIARTYKMHRKFWDGLRRDRVVTQRYGSSSFAFRWDLIHGKVIESDKEWVTIRLDEKYCSFRESPEDSAVSKHAGYCYLYIGSCLAEALETVVSEREARGLVAEAAKGKQ